MVVGQPELSDALRRGGVVDQLWPRVCPTLLGDGRPITRAAARLPVAQTTTYRCGMVELRYRVGGA